MPDDEDLTAGRKKAGKKPLVWCSMQGVPVNAITWRVYPKRTKGVLSNTTWSVILVLSPFFESDWYFAHITVPPTVLDLSSLFHHLLTHELISILNRACPFFLPQLCRMDKPKVSFISLNRAVTNKIKMSEQEKALLKRRCRKKESTESRGLEKWVKIFLGRKGSYVIWMSYILLPGFRAKKGNNFYLSALSPFYFCV